METPAGAGEPARPSQGQAAWLEVSLVVEGELAEAVAEVLGRFVSGGVAIESTAVRADAEDEDQAAGPWRVCGYLPLDGEAQANRRRLEEALWHLGRIRPLPEPQFRTVAPVDWAEAWKEHFHPLPVGRHLLILPAWLEQGRPGRTPLRIEPGMAFGTGAHPTTQLCLEWMDGLLDGTRRAPGGGGGQAPERPFPAEAIDVGCGSGILALAALRLGAARALGVDIDEQALRAARRNAELNGLAGRLELGLGSVAEIRAGAFSLRQAPLVLANILAPVLVRLFAEGLAGLLAPGGLLVLSGILEDQAEEVIAAASAHGLRLRGRSAMGDWRALGFSTD